MCRARQATQDRKVPPVRKALPETLVLQVPLVPLVLTTQRTSRRLTRRLRSRPSSTSRPGTPVDIVGAGFRSGEAVSLTVSGATVDDSIGSANANSSGAFSVRVTLDSGTYTAGSVNSLVATGDAGSKATTSLVIVNAKGDQPGQ